MYIVRNGRDEQEAEFEELDDVLQYFRDKCDGICLDEEFDDYLNDSYPQANICGYEYDPAYALHNLDVATYDALYAEYVDSEIDSSIDDLEHEVNRLDSGEYAEYRLTGDTVTYIEDEEVEFEL